MRQPSQFEIANANAKTAPLQLPRELFEGAWPLCRAHVEARGEDVAAVVATVATAIIPGLLGRVIGARHNQHVMGGQGATLIHYAHTAAANCP